MSRIDWELGGTECQCKCPRCGKDFKYIEWEQTPGFRSVEELCCPYCYKLIRTSMEYEYSAWGDGK